MVRRRYLHLQHPQDVDADAWACLGLRYTGIQAYAY